MHKSCGEQPARGARAAQICNKQEALDASAPRRRTSPTRHSNAAMSQYVDYITVYVGGHIRLMF